MQESSIGDIMDPTHEQDNADCEEICLMEHPDFVFKNLSDFNTTNEDLK